MPDDAGGAGKDDAGSNSDKADVPAAAAAAPADVPAAAAAPADVPAAAAASDSPPAPDASEPAGLEAAKAEAKASAERLRAAEAAAEATLEEEYRKVAETLKQEKPRDSFTDYRTVDIIFRRELGEPEFWLGKRDRAPARLMLSDEEAREISRRVETPTDQVPVYDPQYILSKEYGGMSSYEVGITAILGEAQEGLEELRRAGAGDDEVRRAETEVEKLGYLYQNYHLGMNVFRTAKGGRDRAKK